MRLQATIGRAGPKEDTRWLRWQPAYPLIKMDVDVVWCGVPANGTCLSALYYSRGPCYLLWRAWVAHLLEDSQSPAVFTTSMVTAEGVILAGHTDTNTMGRCRVAMFLTAVCLRLRCVGLEWRRQRGRSTSRRTGGDGVDREHQMSVERDHFGSRCTPGAVCQSQSQSQSKLGGRGEHAGARTQARLLVGCLRARSWLARTSSSST